MTINPIPLLDCLVSPRRDILMLCLWMLCAQAFCVAQADPVPLDVSPDLTFTTDFSVDDLNRLLHPDHPRLFSRAEDWERLRGQVRADPYLMATFKALQFGAEEMLALPLVERTMEGRRMLATSREVLKRILTLGSLYKLTGEERYLDRSRQQLLLVADFVDWNPSHFLDTAEMTLAVSVGYDWLYDELSEGERSRLKTAILEKGLAPGRGPHGFKTGDNNWNQVCFAGMVAGVLAIAEDEPELAVEFLREAMANIHHPLDANRPHGAYPEGAGYWSYGTHFQVILVSILDSALGTNWTLDSYPAFQESAVYVNLMRGPSGLYYNYADGWEVIGLMPALHWFADRAENSRLDQLEREYLLNSSPGEPIFRGRGAGDRFFPLTLFWLDPEGADRGNASPLPLHWRADGPNPVAVHRSSWDDEALFLGIKGGNPSVNHGHMDVGSFVLDYKGLRWASDLGAQSYESLERLGMGIWGRGADSDRWKVFRLNTYSHNTLVFDGNQQMVDRFAPITGFSDDPDQPFTRIDMTAVYQNAVDRVIRTARLLAPDTVLIHDEMAGLGTDQTVRWAMLTPARISLHGNRAILHQEGEVLHATILDPEDATFGLLRSDLPANEWDVPNPGTQMLILTIRGTDNGLTEIKVVLSGESLSEERLSVLKGSDSTRLESRSSSEKLRPRRFR